MFLQFLVTMALPCNNTDNQHNSFTPKKKKGKKSYCISNQVKYGGSVYS